MYIQQNQLKNIKKLLSPNKVIAIYGPRRCGKTTLLEHFRRGIEKKHLLLNGEDIIVQRHLSSQSIEQLRHFIGDHRLIIIDEAQKVNDIGANLKLIVDHIPGVEVVATGSSSFDLARSIGEPLTGRKFTLRMFPLAQLEIQSVENAAETEAHLPGRLIYGSYPEVVVTADDDRKRMLLKEIVSSYLYRDILELDGIRHSDKIVRLLQLLAFQIGKEVSFNELGTQLGMSKNTVERYLDLLEKAFVLLKLTGFSRNLRKEITKNPRYYFYDVGIRNALINNFNPLELRDDVGPLWENYLILERIKRQEYRQISVSNYFWRTYDQKEVDLVEEREGKLFGFECKWSERKGSRPPKLWKDAYPEAEFATITRDNYLPFIT